MTSHAITKLINDIQTLKLYNQYYHREILNSVTMLYTLDKKTRDLAARKVAEFNEYEKIFKLEIRTTPARVYLYFDVVDIATDLERRDRIEIVKADDTIRHIGEAVWKLATLRFTDVSMAEYQLHRRCGRRAVESVDVDVHDAKRWVVRAASSQESSIIMTANEIQLGDTLRITVH